MNKDKRKKGIVAELDKRKEASGGGLGERKGSWLLGRHYILFIIGR